MTLAVLVALLVLLSALAIPSGLLLLADPSGASIGAAAVLPFITQRLPFIHDFTPIGLWLVSVYGCLPIGMAIAVWKSRRWARHAAIVLGSVVIAWISAELLMFSSLGFTPMYPLIGGIGVAILGVSMLPSMRTYATLHR